MRMNSWSARSREIDRVRWTLVRDHYPRLQMGWIVTLTGLAGLGASFLLLQAGMASMALRYFWAMGVAYIVFLLLLWGWLRIRSSSFDIPTLDGADHHGAVDMPAFGGKGGSFDGGGASADYEVHGAMTTDGTGDALGALDAGDATIPLAVAVLIGAIAFSSIFVIYTAPALFAELLVDGVLAASLYRRLRGLDRRHWLESAVRRTWMPFLLTTALVTGAGWGMGVYAPEASSLWQVLHHKMTLQNAGGKA